MDNAVRRVTAPSRRSILISLGATALAATGIAATRADTATKITITGEITYLQRIALPDDAVAIVELRPVGLADGAPVTAAWRHAMKGSQVPVPFTMQVERDRLSTVANPMLRAGIEVDGKLAWLSELVPVDLAAATVDAGTIVLKPFRAPPAAGLVGAADLEGGDWQVIDLAGVPLADGALVTLGFSQPDGFHGRACNSYRGSYTLNDGSIAFGKAAATMMACPEPMASQEHALFRAFEQARQASIDADGRLVLSDAAGTIILRARRQAAQ